MPTTGVAVGRPSDSRRTRVLKARELLRFAIVGGITFVIDNGIWYLLKLFALESKPTVAKGIAIAIATVVSYVLHREWSLNGRGGLARRTEATRFFVLSSLALVINVIPLYASRYVFDLRAPHVSLPVQEVADFVSGSLIGMALATIFRFVAFRRWAFPNELQHPANDAPTADTSD
jgi:putative flippase GtrA